MQALISKPDALCLEALRLGVLMVDSTLGHALSKRVYGKRLGCVNKGGYVVFTLHINGQRAQVKMHRLIWLSVFGPIPAGFMPDHKNRVRHDNRIANLRLVDARGNSANRRSYSGEGNPSAKITEATVRAIRSARGSYSQKARAFGVSKSLIAQISRRELWV